MLTLKHKQKTKPPQNKETHQLVRPCETLRHLTWKSQQKFCLSLCVKLRPNYMTLCRLDLLVGLLWSIQFQWRFAVNRKQLLMSYPARLCSTNVRGKIWWFSEKPFLRYTTGSLSDVRGMTTKTNGRHDIRQKPTSILGNYSLCWVFPDPVASLHSARQKMWLGWRCRTCSTLISSFGRQNHISGSSFCASCLVWIRQKHAMVAQETEFLLVIWQLSVFLATLGKLVTHVKLLNVSYLICLQMTDKNTTN